MLLEGVQLGSTMKNDFSYLHVRTIIGGMASKCWWLGESNWQIEHAPASSAAMYLFDRQPIKVDCTSE